MPKDSQSVSEVFNGEGFSSADFAPEERMQIRHMMHDAAETWPLFQDLFGVMKDYPLKLRLLGWVLILGAAMAIYLNGEVPQTIIKAFGANK